MKVPVRTKEGKLQEEKVVLAANASLHEGYLPYTTNNIIRSAFKFYDSVYGWGGLQQSVDCSSFISNAYRTVGIFCRAMLTSRKQALVFIKNGQYEQCSAC